MDPRIDLFESLVRFLAIKPLKFDEFSLEQARGMIKDERKESVAFISEHSYFETVIDALAKKVKGLGFANMGTLYINLQGKGCTTRMKQNLLELTLAASKIYIFGKKEDWELTDPKIVFVDRLDIFEDNHQRFFIYISPGYSVALVARHNDSKGDDRVESMMSTAKDAISMVAQKLSIAMYRS